MGNRGQKRAETVEDLPADKRACNLQDNNPSSSNQADKPSSSSGVEITDQDMDTSSLASGSSRSEMEPENTSSYNSYESDETMHRDELTDYQRRRSGEDHGKFKTILASLSEEIDDSEKLVLLTELCEVLSFSNEHSLSTMTCDALSPHLVKLSRREAFPDIVLLAIRSMTYLCDLSPRSAAFLVRHDAVSVLCQRLLAIDDMDVAEQCLQALEKISRVQPLVCLQAGAVTAVLSYLDFFSTIIQRVALSSVMNICRKLPAECPVSIMEAVPTLCNLLQYEDRQLVEIVAISLTRITEAVSQSPEMLKELCKHGIIGPIFQLFDSKGGTTLSLPVYKGLLGVFAKLSSGSSEAFKALYELNISSVLKHILSTSDFALGVSSSHTIDGNSNQIYEVLKLLDELLPILIRDQDVPELLEKESFLVSRPELLQKLGMDILPLLIQMVNSGANLYICYCSLSIIKKLICLSASDMLVDLLMTVNISSFLGGVFTRKDPHVVLLALETAELILQKHSNVFLPSFIKEGVFFSMDSLLSPEKSTLLSLEASSQFVVPAFSDLHLTIDGSQRSISRGSLRCLCYAFASGNSERNSCKLEKESVHNLATHIKSSYISSESLISEKHVSDVLHELRALSSTLSNMVKDLDFLDQQDRFYGKLHQIVTKLNGNEPISTFEFIESGIMKSLVHYLSGERNLRSQKEFCAYKVKTDVMEKRFEAFSRLFLMSSESRAQIPILTLVQKLQNGLSSLENFPVILSDSNKLRESYADVPYARFTKYPCFRVCFVRGEGEKGLCEIPKHCLSFDPLSSMEAIEKFLWPKVNSEKDKQVKNPEMQEKQSLSTASSSLSSLAAEFIKKNSPLHLQEALAEILLNAEKEAGNSSQAHTRALLRKYVEEQIQLSSTPDINMETEYSSPKLVFFLDGKQLDRNMTLYQAILQTLMKENEIVCITKAWNQSHTLTYRKVIEQLDDAQEQPSSVQKSAFLEKIGDYLTNTPYFSSTIGSDNTDDILYLLRCLERINSYIFYLISQQRIDSFAEGKLDDLDILKIPVLSVRQNQFVNQKLTEKLEQLMRDSMALSVGGIPAWCNHLMGSFPFLFSFEARRKYFRLAAFGQPQSQPYQLSHTDSGSTSERRNSYNGLPRKKFSVSRNHILESATQMMKVHKGAKVSVEVEYKEEVGTGLGPTLEFYTLLSHELQKSGMGMWRTAHESSGTEFVTSSSGLFPRPWSSKVDSFNGLDFSKVSEKFVLLGQIVAKALQEGRVLDLHLSKAFYKLILGQELDLFDILSFDPQLGGALLEFKALSSRKLFLESSTGKSSSGLIDLRFRNTRIEDLYLDFTLPGYPEIVLASGHDSETVTTRNLEEYISLVVDATVKSGISRQVEAFKSGFNEVFSVEKLLIFTEEELEHLLCGEGETWADDELLDHVKFDHGYTSSSPPIVNLLEIIREFNQKERRAFLQFVTGAPRLPLGGFASLNPKLTIVRKLCSTGWTDSDLPSVMTCANYLKLPPYSSKETMREKVVYAITEGQGSFHLS